MTETPLIDVSWRCPQCGLTIADNMVNTRGSAEDYEVYGRCPQCGEVAGPHLSIRSRRSA